MSKGTNKERKLGLLGRKVGMTQVFAADGRRLGVTAVLLGPCVVVQKKTKEVDGYFALQLGFEEQTEKSTLKPEAGHFKKAGVTPKRFLREFRVNAELAGKYEVGATITVGDLFKAGDMIDLTSDNKGRGYQGVMRRWNMKGFRATHGTHEFFRHGGSIGNREFPGRVFKNRKMSGQWGNERTNIQNIKVVDVLADKNIILLHGSVPGMPENFVTINPAIKIKKSHATA